MCGNNMRLSHISEFRSSCYFSIIKIFHVQLSKTITAMRLLIECHIDIECHIKKWNYSISATKISSQSDQIWNQSHDINSTIILIFSIYMWWLLIFSFISEVYSVFNFIHSNQQENMFAPQQIATLLTRYIAKLNIYTISQIFVGMYLFMNVFFFMYNTFVYLVIYYTQYI